MEKSNSAETRLKRSMTRKAGMLWLVGTVQFILVMIIAQLAYSCSNYGGCYNALSNPISNLGSAGMANGNPAYFTYLGQHIAWPTSSLWFVFNYSIVLFGVLIIAGLFLVGYAFREGLAKSIWMVVLGLVALGVMGVGIFPEDTLLSIHSLSALMSFVGSGISLLLVAAAMHGDRRWSAKWINYTIISGIFSLAAVVVFFFPSLGLMPQWPLWGNSFGFGGMERLISAPILLWLILIPIKLIKDNSS